MNPTGQRNCSIQQARIVTVSSTTRSRGIYSYAFILDPLGKTCDMTLYEAGVGHDQCTVQTAVQVSNDETASVHTLPDIPTQELAKTCSFCSSTAPTVIAIIQHWYRFHRL